MGPSDRVVLTQQPALPSRCAVCLRSADGKLQFVDFGLSFDIDGAVNICTDCVVNIGEVCGLVPVAQVDEAVRECSDALQIVERLQEENGTLRESLDIVSRFSVNLVDHDSASESVTIDLVQAGVGTVSNVTLESGSDDRETSE